MERQSSAGYELDALYTDNNLKSYLRYYIHNSIIGIIVKYTGVRKPEGSKVN